MLGNTVVVRASAAATRAAGALVKRIVAAGCMTLATTAVSAGDTRPEPISSEDFSRMTIEDLANIEITSVSKKAEALSAAAPDPEK